MERDFTSVERCFLVNNHTKMKNRQCTYNVTLGRFRVTIVAVEKQQVLHILSVYM